MSGKSSRRERQQRQEQERELTDLTRFVFDHHPRRGETVPCRMLDGRW